MIGVGTLNARGRRDLKSTERGIDPIQGMGETQKITCVLQSKAFAASDNRSQDKCLGRVLDNRDHMVARRLASTEPVSSQSEGSTRRRLS